MSFTKQASGHSLSTRLIFAFVAVIILTTVAAGVPAFWLIRAQLESQAWARVEDGGRVTLALLETEKTGLDNIATLTAQRPTLRNLLIEGSTDTLRDYLKAFQAGVELDILVVHDASSQLIAGGAPSPWADPPVVSEVAFYVVPSSESGLALLASQPVLDSDTLLGYVTVGVLLDDDFARRLAAETGFDQSIILEGRRTATSLADRTVDSKLMEQTSASGQSKSIAMSLQGTRYYTVLLPIRDGQGEVIALSEVSLPVDRLVTAERQALLTLILSTILVAVVSSVTGGLYARQLTAPLRQLTIAALSISRGDLNTPVPIPKGPIEIATLAVSLEESRANTRRALDDLSQAKMWSETLIQSIVEGIVTFDTHGQITFFSQGAERVTGWSSDEALGRSLNTVFRVPGGDERFMNYIPPCNGKRQISVLNRNEQVITLAVTGARLMPPNSEEVQVALVLRDITEEEAARNLRSYFLSNISHEFRTPLAALNASVELLLEEYDTLSETEIGELLNSIHLSVTGLQTLIDNLLESTSIEAGRFSIQRHPTELDEVINEAVRVMRPLLNRRRQNLSLTELVEPSLINIDSTRMTQVLVNLLSNASKYSPIGQTIDLSLERADDDILRVSVADQGEGISPVERANLFRRFVRLNSQNSAQYGIGLGLSVVKTIVEEHGGEVGVDERPGGGSIFWFTIPLEKNAA